MRSRLQWAGHVERMADDRLPKRAVPSYVSRAGGDEGGQGRDGRTVLRKRRKTGRRRQETEDGGKD